jgi:AraC-like DNA-binding protein
MATDALSDLLKTVRLTGAAYFEIAAQEPWSVRSPAREMILPRILPGADHLIAYHVVTAGRCFAGLVGEEPVLLEAGEVVVFTNADPHVMSSSAGMRAEPPSADMIEIASAGRLPFLINLKDGGGPQASLVCGYLACDARPFNPLLESLPPMLKAGDGRKNDTGWLGQFIHFAVAEVADKRAGSESVLTKLSELMFIDVVRRYIETLPSQDTGWLAGLRDPFIGKALALIHARPSFSWTVEGLARQCGVSRTVLAERFAELVEIPPMHYLAKWRMQVASELLNGNSNMAAIAAQVGYDSEAALQPRLQEDDRRGAFGMAGGRAFARPLARDDFSSNRPLYFGFSNLVMVLLAPVPVTENVTLSPACTVSSNAPFWALNSSAMPPPGLAPTVPSCAC